MQKSKPKTDIQKNMVRYIRYFCFILSISIGGQLFFDTILSTYSIFWVTDFNKFNNVLINLFVVQIMIIILPLSVFGIFTETANEVYLGQNITKYMYDINYRGHYKLFVFCYKEVIVISLTLSIIGYIFMAKSFLSAELMVVIINTVIIIRSLFSWIDIRINKAKLYFFIKENLRDDIITSMKNERNNITPINRIISDMLPKITYWVIAGDDYELNETIKFHQQLYRDIEGKNYLYNSNLYASLNEEERVVLYYTKIDNFFDELVTELLRKNEWHKAFKLSHSILETNIIFRHYKHYRIKHYHYGVLCKFINVLSEMQIDLFGKDWLINYLIKILENGNVAHAQRDFGKSQKEYNDNEMLELKAVVKEGCKFVFNSLISIWKNDSLNDQYKINFIKIFLFHSGINTLISDSYLHVILMLMQTKNQLFIDIVIGECLNLSWFQYTDESLAYFTGQQITIISYIYYLFFYEEMTDITLPDINTYDYSTNKYLASFLSDNIWSYIDEINEMLFAYKQPYFDSLNYESYDKYLAARNEFIMFSAMINDKIGFASMCDNELLNDIITYYTSITHDNEKLEEQKSKFIGYLDFVGYSHVIDNEAISDKFYALMKSMLLYYTKKVQYKVEKIDYYEIYIKQKDLILRYLFADELTSKICTNNKEEGISISDFVEFENIYQIIPSFDDTIINFIVRGLQYEIALKWHSYNIHGDGNLPNDRNIFYESINKYLSNINDQSKVVKCHILSFNIIS